MKTNDWYMARCELSEYEGILDEIVPFPSQADKSRYRVIFDDDKEDIRDAHRDTIVALGAPEIPSASRKVVTCDLGDDKDVIIKWSMDGEGYKAALEKYHAQSKKLMDIFRQDLRDEYLPNSLLSYDDLIYSKAYEDGHSAGCSEITCHYEELVDFVQRTIDIANKTS